MKRNSNIDAMEQYALEHIRRYRLGLRQYLAEAFCRLGHAAAVDDVIESLRRRQLVDTAPFDQERSYYFLTARGAARFGLPQNRSGVLSEDAKITAYAILLFCHRVDPPRERLTIGEFRKYFPKLYRPGLPMHYFVETEEDSARLSLLRVDRGHASRWDRIVGRCRRDVIRHQQIPEFQSMIADGFFQVTILTPFEDKAVRLEKKLLELPQKFGPINVRVEAIPEMLDLIAPVPQIPAPL